MKKNIKKEKTKDKKDRDTDRIVINPPEKDIRESVVIAFMRMNPPTKGHELLVNTVRQIAEDNNSDAFIFLSHKHGDEKNPIPYDFKLKYAREAFGDIIQESQFNNLPKILNYLDEQNYKDVKIVIGSDNSKKTIFNKKYWQFENLEVLQCGERIEGGDGVEGISSTKMREYVLENKKQDFIDNLPKNLHEYKYEVFDVVQIGLQLYEELKEQDLLTERTYSAIQRRKKALTVRKFKNKLKFARKRQARRIASRSRIARRSARLAIRHLRRRYAGKRGSRYSQLSPGEKSAIDKRVFSAGPKVIRRIAKRIVPVARRRDINRTRLNNEYDTQFQLYQQQLDEFIEINDYTQLLEIIDNIQNYGLDEKAKQNIIEKSEESGIDVNELFEVYAAGTADFSENHSPEQAGFHHVNEYIREFRDEEGEDEQEEDEKRKKETEAKNNKLRRTADVKMVKVRSKTGKSFWKKITKKKLDIQTSGGSANKEDQDKDNDRVNEEFEAFNEHYFKADIDGLPPFFVSGKSVGDVRGRLNRLIKTPKKISSITRAPNARVRKYFIDKSRQKNFKDDE